MTTAKGRIPSTDAPSDETNIVSCRTDASILARLDEMSEQLDRLERRVEAIEGRSKRNPAVGPWRLVNGCWRKWNGFCWEIGGRPEPVPDRARDDRPFAHSVVTGVGV